MVHLIPSSIPEGRRDRGRRRGPAELGDDRRAGNRRRAERASAGPAGPALRRSRQRLGRRVEPQRSSGAHAGRVVVRRAVRQGARIVGPHALDTTDFTARQELDGLEAGSDVFVRVSFQSLNNDRALSEPVTGRFVVPPDAAAATEDACAGRRIATCGSSWGGDTAGQGWGINPGLRRHEDLRGDAPARARLSSSTAATRSTRTARLPSRSTAEGGAMWNNIVTPEVAKVAETLDEFRGRYRYNLLDENVRRFNAEVPQIWQWDDHEVTNNWSDSKDLSADARYTEKNVPLLDRARHARVPRVRADAAVRRRANRERVYRHVTATARCSTCSCWTCAATAARTPPTGRPTPGPQTAFLGREQLDWLKARADTLARGVEGDRRRHAARAATSATAPTRRGGRAGRRSPTARPGAQGPRARVRRAARFIKRAACATSCG